MKKSISRVAALLTAAWMAGKAVDPARGESPESTGPLIDLVKRYEAAVNARDTTALQTLFAIDDERFRDIEDHIDRPFGADVLRDLLKWTDDNPDFKYTANYHDIEAFILGDGVGYTVAINDWISDEGRGSARVTFILLRGVDGKWRIVHGHWSKFPNSP